MFETKKGKTIKKVARYQQFEAVNDIVDRTLGLIGKPVERPRSHGSHLAYAGLRQIADDGVRRL